MKMKMKICELCKRLAKTHCESDRAILCWSCDYKVHSANFLVARHSRTLLCQVCQSPTPWTATGLKIGPTVSVCDACVQNYDKINGNEESETRNGDEEMESTDYFDDDDDGDDGEDDEDEEYDSEEETDPEDNQVVPWSPSTPPPTSTANSSSDEGSYSSSSSSLSSPHNQREAQRKRTREDTDRCYNVNYVSRPSQENADAPPPIATVEALEEVVEAENDCCAADVGTVDSVDSFTTMAEKSLKKQRIRTSQSKISESRPVVIVEFIKKLQQQQGTVSSETIAQLRRLSEEEDPSAVDYASSDST